MRQNELVLGVDVLMQAPATVAEMVNCYTRSSFITTVGNE